MIAFICGENIRLFKVIILFNVNITGNQIKSDEMNEFNRISNSGRVSMSGFALNTEIYNPVNGRIFIVCGLQLISLASCKVIISNGEESKEILYVRNEIDYNSSYNYVQRTISFILPKGYSFKIVTSGEVSVINDYTPYYTEIF